MKNFGTRAAFVAASITAVAADLPRITIKGSKFYYPNGTQFFIRGVAYQQDYNGNNSYSSNTNFVDPLGDVNSCKRDLPYLQQLQTNVVRTYAIDPTQNHDECMSLLEGAGIYVFSDLSAPVAGESINRLDPEWTTDIYSHYTQVIDSLAKYSNVIGFFAGNEVSNNASNTDAAPFSKAAVRDMKAYVKSKGYPQYVGYATSDDGDIRNPISEYFNCGDQTDAVDFWGYNIYEWCTNTQYTSLAGSPDEERTQFFSNWSVPVFMAEYGCNKIEPRTWGETAALSSFLSDVWSGGIAYQYFQTANNYGLVNIDGNNVTPNQDFKNLASVISKNPLPTGTSESAYTPTNSPQACPSKSSDWEADSEGLPPTPNSGLCSCMVDSLTCATASHANQSDFGTLFGDVYGSLKDIPGIDHDGTTGQYGPYGMCDASQQLAYAFNAYYSAQTGANQASACNFGGAATSQSPSTPSNCASVLAVASSSVASASSASSKSSHGAAGVALPPSFAPQNFGMMPTIVLSTMALLSGMGMILL